MYSDLFDAYIYFRRNHFQITASIFLNNRNWAKYANLNGEFFEIKHYELDVYAVKSENKREMIKIQQSNNSDRKRTDFKPCIIQNTNSSDNICVSVKRLHISSTTKIQ